MRKTITRLAIAGALLGLGGAEASADSRVQVVALETLGGLALPAEVSAQIDATLRTAAELEPTWRVIASTLTHERIRTEGACVAIDDACLERVAERRSVDRLIVPRLTHAPALDTDASASGEAQSATPLPTETATSEDHLELSLSLYDAYTRRTREVWSGRIEADEIDSNRTVERLARKLMSLLGRLPEEGTSVIRAVAGSEVFLDGRPMGVVPASGELAMAGVRIGRRALRVVRPSGTVWEAPIIVRSREAISVTVDSGAALASFESGAPTMEHGGATLARPLEPPPEWVLAAASDPVQESEVVSEPLVAAAPGAFHLPVLEEHLVRGEFRTTTHARVGFLPNVSSSGARVTAKLRF